MLTQEQKDKLYKAIDRARGPGNCEYVIDDQPGCVMGQLAALEGVDIGTLHEWKNNTISSCFIELPDGLTYYPLQLLRDIQMVWDRVNDEKFHDDFGQIHFTDKPNPDKLRAEMRAIVEVN